MTPISDATMKAMIAQAKDYTVVLLRAGPNRNIVGGERFIWEHARRNFSLKAEGKLPIVCPVTDSGDIAGIGIFATGIDETCAIMDGDPAVMQGIFTYEVHPCRSFPGDCLPK